MLQCYRLQMLQVVELIFQNTMHAGSFSVCVDDASIALADGLLLRQFFPHVGQEKVGKSF